MRLNPVEIISYISEFFPLMAGDLIFSGTPVGVSSVEAGQRGVLKFGDINFSVMWRK
jgi:2-keto-4-pentenoate hydratase/2-oxohepta-3-ene-1,7-dioic acid hydratase in catechol pathway